MFFVLSCGRSGSTTAAETFSQYANCICPHEPEPRLICEATDYFCGRIPEKEIADILLQSRRPTLDGKIYGEANQKLCFLIPLLARLYPESRFVWLIRDGRDVVASMHSRGWYESPARTPALEIWEKGRPQGDQTGDFTPDRWKALSRFERNCWLWNKHNEVIARDLAAIDASRWKLLKLESFKKSLKELEEFLGLEKRREPVQVIQHNISYQSLASWNDWSGEERRAFETHCGKTMDRHYPRWRTPQGDWVPTPGEVPDSPTLKVRSRRAVARLAAIAGSFQRKLFRSNTNQP